MDPHSRLLERYNKDIPDVHQFNRWLREASDQYPDRVLIGEINLAIDRLVAHYGNHDEFHLPFNFHLIHTPWDAVAIRELVARYEAALPEGAWPNWVLGNHDQHRVAARIGAAQARVAMMLLLTLRGTPTLYYGDELGMPDGVIPPDKIKDPWEINVPGLGLGRDPERTPMQWDDSTHAGFCGPDVTPWLPLAPGHEQLNVSAESTDPTSMLSLTQTLLRLRRAHGALNRGAYRALTVSSDTVLAYARQDGAETLVVALNFSAESQQIPAPIAGARPLLTTYCDDNVNLSNSTLTLRPNEGVILR
jgi:alpha-glucosidase